MADYKQILIAFGAAVLVIGTLALWVAYEKGEINALYNSSQDEASSELESVVPPLSIPEESGDTTPINMENPQAVFSTNKGTVTLELFEDSMPITTGNFIKLAEDGFYNGTKFHRVIEGFMIQGGDPGSKGDDESIYGRGGPGYTIKDEFIPSLSNVRGTIAMANTGSPNSGGSQFFINLVDNVNLDFDKEPLSSKHPVFGRVVDGMETLDAIARIPTDVRDIPLEPVIVEKIEIVRY